MSDEDRVPLHRRTLLGGLAGLGVAPALAGTSSSTIPGTTITADAPPVAWQWTADTDHPSVVQSVTETPSGSLVAVGFQATANGTQDVLVRGVDGTGETAWAETVGGQGEDAALDVTVGAGGDLVFCGGSKSRGSSTLDTVAGRIDPPDTIDWFPSYGRSGTNDVAHAVLPRPGDGYLLAGGTHYLGGGAGEGVGRVLAIAADGTKRWDQQYDTSYAGELFDVVRADEGTYAFAGTRAAGDGSGSDAWLGLVDEAGDPLWTETYGASGERIAYALTRARDGGFLFAGTTAPSGVDSLAWIGKVSPTGTLEWEETYGDPGGDAAMAIEAVPNGGYLVAGWTSSNTTDAAWLFEIDENGRVNWEETYGGSGTARFNALHGGSTPTPGGFKTESNTPAAWLLGTGSDGGFDPAVPPTGQRIDELTFLRSFPGGVPDDLRVHRLLTQSVDEITAAVERGSLDAAAGREAVERLELGHRASLGLLQLASDGADGVDASGTPTSTVNMSRRTAEYVVSLIVDLIMTLLLTKKVIAKVVPSSLPDQLASHSEFITDQVDTIVQDFLASEYPGQMVSYIEGFVDVEARAWFNDYIWGPGKTVVSSAIDGLHWLVQRVTDLLTWVIQGGYETGAFHLESVATGAVSPPAALAPAALTMTDLTSPETQPRSASIDTDMYALWGSVNQLNTAFPQTVTDGQIPGSTDTARELAESTVDDVGETVRSVAAWQEEIVDTLMDVNVVEYLVEWGSAVWDVIQQAAETVEEATELWNTVTDATSGAGTHAERLWDQAADRIAQFFEDAVIFAQETAESFVELADDVRRVILNPGEAVDKAWELVNNPGQVSEFVIEATDGTINAVVEHTGETVGILVETSDDVTDEVIEVIEENEDVLVEVASDASDVLEEGTKLFIQYGRAQWKAIEAGVAFGISMLGMIPAAAGAISAGATLTYATERNVEIVSSVMHGDDERLVDWEPDIRSPEEVDAYQNLKEALDAPFEDLPERAEELFDNEPAVSSLDSSQL